MENTILVTGGAGFIGSALVHDLMESTDARVVNVDKLTYSGNRISVRHFEGDDRYRFEQLDVGDEEAIADLLADERPRAIMHLAAESHVDRSIDDPLVFVESNVTGTATLLKCATDYWSDLPEGDRDAFRFLNVSTDEVYGDLPEGGYFTEETDYDPHSPYAASKASADHFVRAWRRTYGLPVLVTNCANNYGPRQFPEKLIPVVILKALAGDPIPIYGDGKQVRDWLHVDDHARALQTVLERGELGETYNVGADQQIENIELVRTICRVLDEELDDPAVDDHASLIEFVEDRPGHDRRYAIDASKLRSELDWSPEIAFDDGMRSTVGWYLDNLDWCEQVLEGDYDLERLGTTGD